MAITAQDNTKKPVEEAGAPEGYEFKKDEKGRISIKKIRKVEVVEVVKEVKKEVKKIVEKVKRGKK